MQGSKGIWKWLVVLCSVSLAACFVAFRAGAFDTVPPMGKAALMESTVDDLAPQPLDKSMIPSSKSGKFFSPEEMTAVQQMTAEWNADRVATDSPVKRLPAEDDRFMSSSKDAMIFEPENNKAEQPEPDDHFMHTSKSGKIFTPAPQRQDSPRTRPINNGSGVGNEGNRPTAPDQSGSNEVITKPVITNPSDGSFMGSSKSAPVFHPAPKVVKVPQQQQPNNPPK